MASFFLAYISILIEVFEIFYGAFVKLSTVCSLHTVQCAVIRLHSNTSQIHMQYSSTQQ